MSTAFVESFVKEDQPMKKIEQRTGYVYVHMVPSEYGNRNSVSTEKSLFSRLYIQQSLGQFLLIG